MQATTGPDANEVAARGVLVDAVEVALERLRGAEPEPRAIALHVSSVLEFAGSSNDGRLLFAVRTGSLPSRTCEPASEAACVPPVPAAPFEPPPPNLVGLVRGLAKRAFPLDVLRHRWLLREMRALGYQKPTLATLHLLNEEELAELQRRLLERVAS